MPTITPLQRAEFPGNRYITILVQIDCKPGELIPRHFHPGIEISYVLEGDGLLIVSGRPDQELRTGDTFHIPAGMPHSVHIGGRGARALCTYVVDKDKPLVSWD